MNQQGSHIEEHLLLQYLLGNLNDTQRASVEQWLRESDANRKTLDRLESLWLETGKLDPPPIAVDTDAAWQRVSSRINFESSPRNNRLIIRIAAAVLVLIGLTILYLFVKAPSEVVIKSELAVITDTLPDGSSFTLNKQSTLSYSDLKGKERRIKLTGEALFKVAKNAEKPFIVESGDASVRVTGTVFDLSAYPQKDVVVTVTEGTVILSYREKNSLKLTAGQSGIIRAGTDKPVLTEELLPDMLYQPAEFSSEPLSSVFPIIERNFGVKIIAENPAILDCRITASFSGDPSDRIMEVIAESFGLKLRKEGNTYYLNGDGCR